MLYQSTTEWVPAAAGGTGVRSGPVAGPGLAAGPAGPAEGPGLAKAGPAVAGACREKQFENV